MVNAVLLAGTDKKSKIYGKNKPFLSIAGKLVFEYVLDALVDSQNVNRILLVGPKIIYSTTLDDLVSSYKSRKLVKKDIWIEHETEKKYDYENFLYNLTTSYKSLGTKEDELVLYIPSDIPLVKGKNIDDFVKRCMLLEQQQNNDFYYCYVDNVKASRDYKQHSRSGFITSSGKFRPGNLALVKPSNVGKPEILAKAFSNARKLIKLKSKFLVAHYGGYRKSINLISRYYLNKLLEEVNIKQDKLVKKLSISELEDFVSKAFSTRFKLVPSSYSELEYDIDSEADYINLKRIIEREQFKTKAS